MIVKSKKVGALILIVAAIFLVLYLHNRTSTVTVRDVRSRHSSRGYVVNLKYGGQQASAEHALVLQQCWLGALNLTSHTIVEPFVRQTAYQGYPPQKDESVLSFSDLHDLAHYNHVSQSKEFAQLAVWKDFLENAPRNVVFVILGSSSNTVCSSRMTRPGLISTSCCKLQLKSEETGFLSQKGFCIVRIVELSQQDLHNHTVTGALFGPWNPTQVTLVFNRWEQGNSAQRLSPCSGIFRKRVMTDLLMPSNQLLEEAKAYSDKFLGGRVMLSVMMRVERIIEQSVEGGHLAIARQNKASRKEYLDQCFRTLFDRVYLMGNKRKPFVTTDVGVFSSNSWRRILSVLNYTSKEEEHVFNLAKTAVERLVNQTFADWEKTFVVSTASSRHWQSPAYIAALQRTIASSSDCLLLFGGGNFQEVALSAYVHNHPNRSAQCVHIVCASRELRRNLKKIL